MKKTIIILIILVIVFGLFACVSTPDEYFIAAENGKLTEMQILLSEGADVRLELYETYSPLALAISTGKIEIARMLKAAGAVE